MGLLHAAGVGFVPILLVWTNSICPPDASKYCKPSPPMKLVPERGQVGPAPYNETNLSIAIQRKIFQQKHFCYFNKST